MRMLMVAVIALAVAACASIGRPEGGPRDEIPPGYVRSNPAPGSKNFNKNRIEIYFDENIKLEDASNKFIVSPAQQQMPQISANGRKLTVTLRDSLLPDETYTLDFSDAIRDLNEGNILDGFVLDFATGDSIDSLRIAGMVLQAENLEPAQGMIVGAYRNLADSAISTIKVERLCKTNQLGQFTLMNLKPTYYRLFAFNDNNRDFHWDRSEDVAFYNAPIKPWSEEITVTDTLRAQDGTDSIATRQGIRYMPNDILLTWFNENYVPLYMKDHTRNERNKIQLQFSTAVDSLPVLTVLNGENKGRVIGDYSRLQHSLKNDTLVYWLEDSSLIMQDSLLIETRYLKTDTNNMITWTNDTIRYFFRLSRAAEKELENKAKEKEKKEKKRQEAINKWHETGDSSLLKDTIPEPEPIEYLSIQMEGGSSQDYHKPLRISFGEPVKSMETAAIRMEWEEDSVWKPIADFQLVQDTTGKILNYYIDYRWDFDTKYRLTIDSASVYSIYDKWNKSLKHEFKVKGPEEYSTLIFDIPTKPYKELPIYNWDSLRVALYPPADSAAIDSTLYNRDALNDSTYLALLPGVENPLNVVNEDSVSVSIGENVAETVDNLGNVIVTTDSLSYVENDSIGRVLSDSIIIGSVTSSGNDLPQIVVQLLSTSDAVVASAPVIDGKARFDFLNPGTYYARAFIDFNGNGVWDEGSVTNWRQPEDVFYYPKKINLKQNWDMAQTWDLFELPLDIQKPLEIKKNKPKTKDRQSTVEDEEEDEDGFGSNYFYDGTSYGNGSQYNNARNSYNNAGRNTFGGGKFSNSNNTQRVR